MPKKGTKRVKAHIRQGNMATFGKAKIKNPFSETKVIQPYFRKKKKKQNYFQTKVISMSKINEKKLEAYANKLYRGDLARYKEKLESNDMFSMSLFSKQENRIERIPPSKPQEKTTIKNCKGKCVICGKEYKDRDDFDFHHINGDRSKTITPNLALVCLGCHRKIHTRAKSKLKDYKVGQGGKKPNPTYGLPEIKPIKIKMYKPPKYN